MFGTGEIPVRVARVLAQPMHLALYHGGCNNRCTFCPAAGRPAGSDLESPSDTLPRGPVDPRLALWVGGAEPTVQPGLERLLQQAEQHGFRERVLWTNGRRFYYEEYARELLRLGVTGVVLYLPGPDRETYGRVAGVGEGFDQAVRGLENLNRLSGRRCAIDLLVPVTAENVGRLEPYVDLVLLHGVRRIVLAGGADEEDRVTALAERLRAQGCTPVRLEPADRDDSPKEAGGPWRLPEVTRSDLRVGRTGLRFPHETVVYPTFRCNAACGYCPVDRHRPDPAADLLTRRVEEAAEQGYLRVCFNGGEPTLSDRLVPLIQLARERAIPEIALQTNGIRLEDPTLCRALVEAGLGLFQVTLPGHTPGLVDRLFGVSGAFDRILRGVENLLELDVPLLLHQVINQENLESLPAFPGFVRERFGRVAIGWSYVVAHSADAHVERYVPGFSETLPLIRRAVAACEQEGIPYGFPDCFNGLAPCLLPEQAQRFGCLLAPPETRAGDFLKPDLCAPCVHRVGCPGLRSGYVRQHGLEGVHPVTEPGPER